MSPETPAKDPVLRIRLSDLVYEDSYGVEDSSFNACKLCEKDSGAGLLRKANWHAPWCPVAKYQARVAKRATGAAK